MFNTPGRCMIKMNNKLSDKIISYTKQFRIPALTSDEFKFTANTPIVTIDKLPGVISYRQLGVFNPQIHKGQRKLLISEIQALTQIDVNKVVYAGLHRENTCHCL